MEEIPLQIILVFILSCCGIGIIFGLLNWIIIMSNNTDKNPESSEEDKKPIDEEALKMMNETSSKIQVGAQSFLMQEFLYLFIFIIVFGFVTLVVDDYNPYTTIAFVIGAITSIISGYIGMYVATRTNVRVTYNAAIYKSEGAALKHAFNIAFRGGCVMGFFLVSLALGVLTILMIFYLQKFKPTSSANYTTLFEYIAGYGLGGSTVALFCRVGGGIYTKAADVGADLVGKNVLGFEEDSPENPAVIADNVGDNVGDIAGMGSDLFGSLAESTVAALVISGKSEELTTGRGYFFPMLIVAGGIIICLITSFAATEGGLDKKEDVESKLKWQLIISTILLTPTIIGIGMYCLPKYIEFNKGDPFSHVVSSNKKLCACVLGGLWAGLAIGYLTDYYTSNSHTPVKDLSESCKFGAPINIISGLALGFKSTFVPISCIVGSIYLSYKFAGMYGIALAAIGMLSNLPICLAIDGYGPISDNAGGISELSGLPQEVRDITDALDAAGNTTAAIGKGFAIGSACLVALALFGAFITRTKLEEVDILDPIVMSSLIVGAMIPYLFSALTMKAVGEAAAEMCHEVIRQVESDMTKEERDNGYKDCISISTRASLKEMILPGFVVLFTPIFIGSILGPKACAGYLSAVIASGVQMAISASNSGGAWDNAKKYIEAGKLEITEEDRKTIKNNDLIKPETQFFPKKSLPHQAAVVGDTVGDPLKDTSGPSINILIKLSAVTCLIFGNFFRDKSVLNLRLGSS